MEASSWDALRKQARRLEAQLDDQMIAYRKLVSMKSDGSENDIEADIERSLKQLQQVNSQMQTWVSSGGSEVLSHTLTRHMEILQDLTQEFYRLRSSLREKQQHASLLDLRDFDRAKFDVEEAGESEALLREQAAISRNSGQVDSVISQAQATLGALMSQRSTFGGITTKISNVSSRIPTINHVLASIRRKKSMDTIILSLVASVCAFLMFIYWLSK
jgi:Golgi SNAP receptor complex protein 1